MPRCVSNTKGGLQCKRSACEGIRTCSSHAPDCSICLDKMVISKSSVLACGHAFHVDCIDKWTDRSNLCPICKTVIEGVVIVPQVKCDESIDESLYNSDEFRSCVIGYVHLVDTWSIDTDLWLTKFNKGAILFDVKTKVILRYFDTV